MRRRTQDSGCPHQVVFVCAALSALLAASNADAVDFDPIFSPHAVLQAGARHRISGTGDPGEHVTVSFHRQTTDAIVGDSGRWTAWLEPLEPSSVPIPLVAVGTSSGRAVLEDVLVGQVWICAGQSNMAFPLARANGGPGAAEESTGLHHVRLLNFRATCSLGNTVWSAQQCASVTPSSFFAEASWSRADPETSAAASAVGFFFGRYLSYELDMPVGVISVAVGGTPTEAWVPRQSILDDEHLASLVLDFPSSPAAHPFVNERARRNLSDWLNAPRQATMPNHPFRPGFMYEAAITRFAGLPVAGVLWYQGESNAHNAAQHERLFRMLAMSLRAAFNRRDLPILTVQLPGLNREEWPEFRESQFSVTNVDGVEIVTMLDVGHPRDVHPREKRVVGERLARLALQAVYERAILGLPPRLEAVVGSSDGWVELVIADGGAGLRSHGVGIASSFWVASSDRLFHRATEVEVRGDLIRVKCADIMEPVAVRYAWSADPQALLVRIDDDMPVLPFRTDDWPSMRVACAGDSITQGIGLNVTYPAALSRLAGPLFDVRNFGRSGTTVQTSIKRSGWRRGFTLNVEHGQILAFEPDLVILNLGINDLSLSPFDVETFEREYESIVTAYQALPSSPTVCVWTPLAPLFPGQRYFGSPQVAEINEAIARVAERTGAVTIDMHTGLAEYSEWFPDHLHPNDAGAAAIARETHKIVAELGLPVSPLQETSP